MDQPPSRTCEAWQPSSFVRSIASRRARARPTYRLRAHPRRSQRRARGAIARGVEARLRADSPKGARLRLKMKSQVVRERLGAELGAIPKQAPFMVVLAYPSPYAAAMSSLGYQRIYRAIQET